MNMASSLKRILETNEDLSNKRVKICTEVGHFYEVQSNKNVLTVGKNSSDYWRSSYQRYFLRYYGDYSGRKRSVKNKIRSKKKVVDGLEENIDKVDANTIDEIVVRQPSFGSDACNERFDSDFNKIEAFGSS